MMMMNSHITPPPPPLSSLPRQAADDIVQDFIDHRCEAGGRAANSALFGEFRHWLAATGVVGEASHRAFSRAMKRLGWQQANTGQARYWHGLHLRGGEAMR